MNCDNNAMPSANPNSSIIKENVFSFNDEMNRIAEWPTTRKSQRKLIFLLFNLQKKRFSEIFVSFFNIGNIILKKLIHSIILKIKEKTFSFYF